MKEEIDLDIYLNNLKQSKEIIAKNKVKALLNVNKQMIMAFYEIGTIINERNVDIDNHLERLAHDLEGYGKIYSKENLIMMSNFAGSFSKEEIVTGAVTNIPWESINIIISKSKSHEEMLYYINETYNNNWSRYTIEKQFELKSYEKSKNKNI